MATRTSTSLSRTSDDATQRPQTRAKGLAAALLEVITAIPDSSRQPSPAPASEATAIRRGASRKAALAAGSLALPPGPLGYLTILPELYAVWRIQAQMVADLAALHGRRGALTAEHMAYCLFRHTAAQALRDVVARVGERYLVTQASTRVIQRIAKRVGISFTQRTAARTVSRWIPVAGAAGVAAYAYYDTSQVARTAIEFFSSEIAAAPVPSVPRVKRKRKSTS